MDFSQFFFYQKEINSKSQTNNCYIVVDTISTEFFSI